MPIYRLTNEAIEEIPPTTFSHLGVTERGDLQRVLRDNISAIDPHVLVISEEFGRWEDSRRRIDLLGIDRDANIVVIELKRTEDGGHMELQAIRYAAMVSTLTFEQACEIFGDYLEARGEDLDPREKLLEHLGCDSSEECELTGNVRIVLASAEFSKELTTAVLWLYDNGIDIRCIRIKPYDHGGERLIDVQQLVPLPEAADYMVGVRDKNQRKKAKTASSRDLTRFRVTVAGETFKNQAKRRAMLRIVQAMVQRGVTPQQINEAVSWRTVLYRVPPAQEGITLPDRAFPRVRRADARQDLVSQGR